MSNTNKPGQKFDGGKSPVVQACLSYFPRALLAVGMVSKYGADKYEVPYSDQNWRKVDNGVARYTDGLGRHVLNESVEGPHDHESGLLHAAHAAWNALAKLETMLTDGAELQVKPRKPFVKPEKRLVPHLTEIGLLPPAATTPKMPPRKTLVAEGTVPFEYGVATDGSTPCAYSIGDKVATKNGMRGVVVDISRDYNSFIGDGRERRIGISCSLGANCGYLASELIPAKPAVKAPPIPRTVAEGWVPRIGDEVELTQDYEGHKRGARSVIRKVEHFTGCDDPLLVFTESTAVYARRLRLVKSAEH